MIMRHLWNTLNKFYHLNITTPFYQSMDYKVQLNQPMVHFVSNSNFHQNCHQNYDLDLVKVAIHFKN